MGVVTTPQSRGSRSQKSGYEGPNDDEGESLPLRP